MHPLRIAHPKMTLLIGKPLLQILKSVCVESANNKLQLKSAGLFAISSRASKRTMAGVCPSNMFQKPDSLPNSLGNTRVLNPFLGSASGIAGSRTYFILRGT